MVPKPSSVSLQSSPAKAAERVRARGPAGHSPGGTPRGKPEVAEPRLSGTSHALERSTGPQGPRQDSPKDEDHGRQHHINNRRRNKGTAQGASRGKGEEEKEAEKKYSFGCRHSRMYQETGKGGAETLGKLRLDFSWISSERRGEGQGPWGHSGVTSKMPPLTVGESEDLGGPAELSQRQRRQSSA